jgi:transcriptional regulator with XRE-family HTH domain
MSEATLERAVEADEIIGALRRVGLTQHDIATAVRVSDRTVHQWAKASVEVRSGNYDRLTDIRDVVLLLRDSLTERGIKQWLRARNRMLDGRRPLEVLHAGDAEAVRRAARAFSEGVYL